MWDFIVNDLLNDGYSKWFAIAFGVSCALLVWDILKNGWNLDKGGE